MVGAPDEQHNGCSEGACLMAKRKFTREFKLSAVQLVNQQGYSIPEAARSLGVDPNCVRYWIAKLGGEAGTAPSGEGAVQAELRRLRKENARLLMERDILKKAAAFFAREQP
jgi:transposase